MKMINELLYGLKSGELWYLKLALYTQIASTLLYLWTTTKRYGSYERQKREVAFSVRLACASFASILISLIAALGLPRYLGAFAGVVAIVLIFNIERLPIWEEEEVE